MTVRGGIPMEIRVLRYFLETARETSYEKSSIDLSDSYRKFPSAIDGIKG